MDDPIDIRAALLAPSRQGGRAGGRCEAVAVVREPRDAGGDTNPMKAVPTAEKPPSSSLQLRATEALARAGKARTAVLLWLLGIPLPLILLFLLLRGCA
jgi:hypothetical protein